MHMESILLVVIGIGVGIGGGILLAHFFEKSRANKIKKNTRKEALNILREANQEAEAIKRDKILQAKEKFIELKSEHEILYL